MIENTAKTIFVIISVYDYDNDLFTEFVRSRVARDYPAARTSVRSTLLGTIGTLVVVDHCTLPYAEGIKIVSNMWHEFLAER